MRESARPVTYLIIAMLAWGSVYPVSKYLMTDISPMTMAFLRYIAAIITLSPMFIIEIRKNSKKIDFKSLIILTAAGLAGTAVFSIFLYFGIAHSTASNGSILINTQPVFTAVLAFFLLGESISRRQIIGIAIGIAGIVLVVTGGDFSLFKTGGEVLSGNLLLLCGAVSMSLYGILIKEPVRRLGSLATTYISMLIGTVVLFFVNFIINKNFFTELSSPSGMDILLIIYLGSIATAAAYLFFSMSLKYFDVVRATAFKFLIPVSGITLSILFLGERPASAAYAGIFIVIISIFLIQRQNNFINADMKTRM
ncbi:MAG: DMT family transporter [Spirochaetales bacterium]|uniref:DMT family transporter n=1 Tax=Candidatus Thalassospirochaeta sargassi TaxID=3119039 RepID=A0AAJ1MJ62_9SPIO|nr:DMT family transporter [Spirochaetales bacterium]